MQKLRTFLNENSDVIWPALCLVFCALTIVFAAMRSITSVEGNAGPVVIVKHNPNGVIKVNSEKAE